MSEAELGNLLEVCRIAESFGREKVATIKRVSIFVALIALLFSVLAGIGVHDLEAGLEPKGTVVLLSAIAGGAWLVVTLLMVGGLSSRAAGARSELRVHAHGFILVRGKRFGGVQTDACRWDQIAHASEKAVLGIFVGYTVETTAGRKLFLSANFDGLAGKVGHHLRSVMRAGVTQR